MTGMFARIRWRLVAWTMLVLGLLMLLLGSAVYLALAQSLLAVVDRNLDSRADQAAGNLAALASGERGDDRGDERGGVFFLVLAPDGRVLANPQRVPVAGVSLPRLAGRRAFATVSLEGEPTRVYIRPMGGRVPPGSALLVGQSLVPVQSAQHALLFILVAGGGLGLALSFAGGWFLSGRALVPIQQAFTRQQEFVADASHELRTPLTVLRSATDLLNHHRAEPLEANGELFDDVRAEIARMERLAGDLLTLARSDQGELSLEVAPVDVAALAADVVRRTVPLAEARGVRLTGYAPAAGDPGGRQNTALVAEADPDRIQQVLLILLDNAIKHTPAGGTVEVTARREPGAAVLEVADTGSGIAPEHLLRVFDRFYRADPARSRQEGGTGLGLAIAKLLVHAHGGDLSLASAPGAGTRATVRLPLAGGATPIGRRLSSLAARLTAVRRSRSAAGSPVRPR